MLKSRTVAAAFLALALGTGFVSLSIRAQAEDTDLPSMVANAKTPADHEAIAKQYDALAAQAESQAAMHKKMGANYKSMGGAAIGKYHMDHHCAVAVKDAQSSAAEYKSMAAAHRAMAAKTK